MCKICKENGYEIADNFTPVGEMVKLGSGASREVENPEGNLRVELTFDGEIFWTTQKRMTEIFNVDVSTISSHFQQIFDSGELNKYSVIQKIKITANDEKQYDTKFYMNLSVWALLWKMNVSRRW